LSHLQVAVAVDVCLQTPWSTVSSAIELSSSFNFEYLCLDHNKTPVNFGEIVLIVFVWFADGFFLLWRKEGPCGAPHSESRQSEQGHTRSSRDLWWRWKAPFWSSPSDPTGTNM